MANPFNRKTYRWLVISVSIITLLVLSEYFLSRYIENTIKRKLTTLNATAADVEANLLFRSLIIKEVEWLWSPNKASLYPRSVFSKQVSIHGIQWLPLFFNETLKVEDLSFNEGLIEFNVRVRRNSIKTADSSFTSFSFSNMSLHNINAKLVNDTVTKNIETVYIKAGGSNKDKCYAIYVAEAMATKVHIDWPDAMYRGSIERVKAMSKGGRMIVDSIQLTPTKEKIDFGKQAGRQISRITLAVPQLVVNDLQLQEIFSNALVIPHVHIESFNLAAFKDKRLPFIQVKDRTLPMESLRKIPFAIRIDSITIGRSHITAEEFPKNGTTTSTISFENVEAVCTGINNNVQSNIPVSSLLKAKGQLMGNGLVEAVFELPLNDPAVYSAKGTISQMNLVTLNPVLAPMTNLQIKSGYVNELSFQFEYSDYTSQGSVGLTYRDLQLTEQLNRRGRTQQWESAMISSINYKSSNLFASTGIINIERNRKKWIFNVWWESIQDGLRSCMTEEVVHASVRN